MKKIAVALLCLAFVLSATKQLRAQNYVYATGNPTFSTQIPIENGFINVNNGEIHIEIPLAQNAQRGKVQLDERLIYDSRIWKIIQNGGYSWSPTNVENSMGGWRFSAGFTEAPTYQFYYSEYGSCGAGQEQLPTQESFQSFAWTDLQGTQHVFPLVIYQQLPLYPCAPNQTPSSASSNALDGSGYSIKATYDPSFGGLDTVVYDKQGNEVYPLLQDPNGNYMSSDSNGNLVDTLGVTPVITSTSGNQIYYDVLTFNGGRSRYTVTTETINYNTAFGQQAVGEVSGSFTAIQSIQLPDGNKYSFGYDSGTAAGNYGELTSVTLPSGGVIQYTYTNFLDSFQNQNRWLHTMVKDGGTTTFTPSTITNCSSSAGCQEKNTVTSPKGDDTVYTFTLDPGNNANANSWNTGIAAYQGSASGGTELKTVNTSYTYNTVNELNAGDVNVPYIVPHTQTVLTSLPDAGVTTKAVTTLDSIGANPTNVQQWDYYSGTAPSNPLEQVTYTYNNGYVNGASVPTQVITTDGTSNAVVSEVVYKYDETTPTTTSGLPNHNSVTGNRGNLTTISQWINSSGASLSTTNSYDDAGTLLSSTSPNGITTYGYDSTDTFAIRTTPPTPSSGVSLASSASYDIVTGLLNSTTDPNGTQTVYKNYDAFGRYGEVDILDSGNNTVGKTVYTYSSPNLVYVEPYQSTSKNGTIATQIDGYGRTIRVAVYNGQSGNDWYQQDTCYDTNGNVNFQSYQYQGTGFNQAKVCSGSGDTYSYDALGRTIQVAHADGSSINTSYKGRAIKVADENGVTKISQVDALGRTTIVCEVSGATLQVGTSTSPTSCGTDIASNGFVTNYTYNRLNLETTVTQGAQSRVFQNDWVGRPVLTQEPERGQTTYSYVYNGTGLLVTRQRPKANQTSPNAYTKTATQYDSMGRIISITYDDGLTPIKGFTYDTNCCWPQEMLTNIKGRLAVMGGQVGSSTSAWTGAAFSYDATGRIIGNWACTPTTCGTSNQTTQAISYAWDWTGNLTSEQDWASGKISYTRSPAGEVQQILNNTFPIGSSGATPATLVSSVVNGPYGPISYHLGNGLNVYRTYDGLGRLNGKFVCNGSPTQSCQGGTQIYGTESTTAGVRVVSIADTVQNQAATFGYDDFNRLTSRTITQGTTQNYTYTYDRYGNRWEQTPAQGGNLFSVSYDATTNHINSGGYVYDAAGNITNDGLHSYTYDAEGNILQVDGGNTATYVYDSMNRRIRSQVAASATQQSFSTEEYLYDYFGHMTSIWNPASVIGIEGVIYWDGDQIAFRDGPTYFDHQDDLGTERARTDSSGNLVWTHPSLPWGDAGPNTYGGIQAGENTLDFAGLYADNESNTEHAQFRQYASAQGHWMSPDPYDGSYDFSNPQSFNRYAYVTNNPLSFADPTGLVTCNCPSDPPGDPNDPSNFVETIIDDIASLFSGPSFHGSLHPRPNSQPWDEYHIHYGPNIAGALGLPDAGCEFGACGIGPSAFGPGGSSTVQTGVGLLNDGIFTYVGLLEELGSLRHPYRLFGTRWCGPGGGGGTTSNVDAACRAHDLCYGAHGLSFLPNLGIGSFDVAQTQAARACNQSLYNAVKMYPNEHGSQAIQLWLTNGVGVGILAPGTSVVP